jgi:solute carrier family 38 (sodium-coupled neutral amino acid transporter), member 7/8
MRAPLPSRPRRALSPQVHKVLGARAAEVMAWTIFVFLFGSCVAFEIIAGDTFGAVMRHFVIGPHDSVPEWLGARQIMILLPAVTVMLPLSLLRSMGALAASSTLAVGVMAATTLIIVSKAAAAVVAPDDPPAQHSGAAWERVDMFTFDVTTFTAMPVMIFAYHCHVQAVPIYYELTESPKLWPPCAAGASVELERLSHPRGRAAQRKLTGMAAVLSVAFAECSVLYLATGISGYSLFPDNTSSNILNNFDLGDGLMLLVRFIVGWAVVLHYPINQHVARSALYDLVCTYARATPATHVPYKHIAGLTVVFFSATTATACVVSDLGVVFQVIGGVAGSLLIFILPGALLVRSPRAVHPATAYTAAADAARGSLDGSARGARLQAPNGVHGRRGSLSALPPSGLPTSRGANSGSDEAALLPRHDPEGPETDEAAGPNCHSAWDTPAVGCVLIAVGAAVLLLTVWTTVATYIAAQGQADGEGQHSAQGTARALLDGSSLTHVFTA